MKKIFKWVGIVLGILVGLIGVLVVTLLIVGNSYLNRTYTIPVEKINLPTDAASLAKGKRLVNAICGSCHGPDLSGVTGWMSAGPIGTVDSANLTAGAGGIGAEYTSTEDYVRAIRHGVDPDGKATYMPAVTALSNLGDDDLGAIIAYLKTIPPIAHTTNGQNFGPLGKIMIGAGMFGKFPVDEVDHNAHPVAPPAAVNVEYGQYLVNIIGCRSCHGEKLAGGPYPDPSVKVLAPNLTPGGELAAWTEQDFIATLRSGKAPSGHTLNNKYMPWKGIGGLTDDELKAIWLYLSSLPKLPTQTTK